MSDKSEDDQSYILKPPDPADIFTSPHKEAVTEFLQQNPSVIAKTVVGLLTSSVSGNLALAGRVVQAALKLRYFRQFAAEIEDFRGKNRIADDWPDNKQGFQTWVELMTVIDLDTPDEERLDAMKAMFYAVNQLNAADAERITAYQLFQIAKKLTSGELLLLKASYELGRDPNEASQLTQRSTDWQERICKRLGHTVTALIRHHEKALVENDLLSPRLNNGVNIVNKDARLTNLGVRFCESIETYQAIKKKED